MNIFEQFESLETRSLTFKNEKAVLPAMVMRAQADLGTLGSQLYLGYMNQGALDATLETGEVTMWSMVRDRLYRLGDEDGGGLTALEVLTDYERTLILINAGRSAETNQ